MSSYETIVLTQNFRKYKEWLVVFGESGATVRRVMARALTSDMFDFPESFNGRPLFLFFGESELLSLPVESSISRIDFQGGEEFTHDNQVVVDCDDSTSIINRIERYTLLLYFCKSIVIF